MLLSGCSYAASTIPLPEAQSETQIPKETQTLKDILGFAPVRVEGEIYGSRYNSFISIDEEETIQSLLKDLDEISVEPLENTPNTAFPVASYRFIDTSGKLLRISESNRLSLSGDDIPEGTLYSCLDGATLQSIMRDYIKEEPVFTSDGSSTFIEPMSLEQVPALLQDRARSYRVYEDSGNRYATLHLHLGAKEADATYGMAVQFLKDGEWFTVGGYPHGDMIERANDYYFQLEAGEGLLCLCQLRLSREYVNDPVVTYKGQTPQASVFYIDLTDAVSLGKGQSLVIASTRENDLGQLVQLQEYQANTEIEQNRFDQRLILTIE